MDITFFISVQFSDKDFEYLGSLGAREAVVDRGSLLLKFDPLLGVPVPTNTFVQQSICEENDEDLIENEQEDIEFKELEASEKVASEKEAKVVEKIKEIPEKETCDEKMSLVISNAMKDITIEDKLNAENHIMSASENESKMSELEKKAKNEV